MSEARAVAFLAVTSILGTAAVVTQGAVSWALVVLAFLALLGGWELAKSPAAAHRRGANGEGPSHTPRLPLPEPSECHVGPVLAGPVWERPYDHKGEL